MQYEPGKSPLIRNLLPGLTEIGKIKIGKKGTARPTSAGTGTWRPPVKLDHFIVTGLERDAADNDNFKVDVQIMKILGEKPRKIPIRLLFDSVEANFQSRYSCYRGKTLFCSGDGEGAFQTNEKGLKVWIQCPCGREQPGYKGQDKCKINGVLSCIIDGADVVGGVWKFRTTGYNSTVGMQSSLCLIRSLSGGLLAGLDLDMTIQKKVGTDPDGKSVTIEVVGVLFRGSIQALQKKSLEIASTNAEFRVRLAHVEEEVIKMIGVDSELVDQAGDIVEEFHPEQSPAPQLATPQAGAGPSNPVQPTEAATSAGTASSVTDEPAPKTPGAATVKKPKKKFAVKDLIPAEPDPPDAESESREPVLPPLVKPENFDLFEVEGDDDHDEN
jgi:hypothetical protein